MKTTCLSAITAAVALTLVTACGAAGNPGGPDMEGITATIAEAGFTCEMQDRHPETMVQVSQCRSNEDKYLSLIVNEWKDPEVRDRKYRHDIPRICDKLGLKNEVRWSTSGNWLLVAGGSSEKDWNALDTATESLGFERHAVACQS